MTVPDERIDWVWIRRIIALWSRCPRSESLAMGGSELETQLYSCTLATTFMCWRWVGCTAGLKAPDRIEEMTWHGSTLAAKSSMRKIRSLSLA